MKIGGPWTSHHGTQALCATLALEGHRILFVGGCVRNALMGLRVSDIDMATDAAPVTVMKLAEEAGFKVIPTGIDHGTVTVIAGGAVHEITTFRRDVATDGRRATVAYSRDIAEDAARRDFTMNALYAEPSGEVLDPLGGLPDLLAHRVRFVGDPSTRIREDYLRILRFFRFHAAYGDPMQGIDAEGLAACAALSDGIQGLSRERVGHEMRKLLSAPDPAPALAAMQASGVLAQVLPGADPRGIGPLVHLETLNAQAPRWQRRLCLMGGEGDLRLSRSEAAEIVQLRDQLGSSLTPAALGWKLGITPASDVILARAALFETPLPERWQAEIDRGAAAHFPVAAADLMPALQGPELGARLKALETAWLASDLTLTRDQLLA
ncbi:CCA tRNA nucleotidyltransferase [Stagnihabitans tardus]|uniref:CCA tRNA nucleotidyltransferase n=1 Tax=Stagnihabitans tardus TaxID=2699202 RepID=A0AAE4YAS1_9RHOB|nr:CCA tRNA nucleotidyltransferase [Stagnihabitans tardus]NBZ86834.1 CCA tRNA nucleotidyltransferase [Stagnihabitans tardus]